MKKIVCTILLICATLIPVFAKNPTNHVFYEKDYQKYWCTVNGGDMEIVLGDGTRVDCLTKNYAVEFDFAKKWAESIGQSLYYAAATNRKPGVVLIMEKPLDDIKYLKRLKKVADSHGITVWTISPRDLLY